MLTVMDGHLPYEAQLSPEVIHRMEELVVYVYLSSGNRPPLVTKTEDGRLIQVQVTECSEAFYGCQWSLPD